MDTEPGSQAGLGSLAGPDSQAGPGRLLRQALSALHLRKLLNEICITYVAG